jgi:hypothetical protein
MPRKARLSASVDADLIAAGQAAVAAGTTENLSAWVSEALHRQAEHDRRLAALGGVLADFESEHGALSDAEIADASRWARERAVVVRGAAPPTSRSPVA